MTVDRVLLDVGRRRRSGAMPCSSYIIRDQVVARGAQVESKLPMRARRCAASRWRWMRASLRRHASRPGRGPAQHDAQAEADQGAGQRQHHDRHQAVVRTPPSRPAPGNRAGLQHQRGQRHQHHQHHRDRREPGLLAGAVEPHRDREQRQRREQLVRGAEQRPELRKLPCSARQQERAAARAR